MISSFSNNERFAPIDDPMIAAMTDGIANFKFTSPFLIKRYVASVVPHADDSLFVATAACGGIPAIK